MSNFDQLYMCILNLYHIKPEVSMVWQMYIFCHHNTCSFHFCGTKLMYVYCIKRVPRLHQRAPNGTQIFPQWEGATPSHTLPWCRLCRHRRPAQWISQPAELFLSNIPHYPVARRYELHFLALFLPRENKIHIFKPPCNVLFII